MTEKTVQWAPYDFKQAADDLSKEAKRGKQWAEDRIEEALSKALQRLQDEAKTFAQIPPDLGAFLKNASAISIGAFDPSPYDPETIEIHTVTAHTHSTGGRPISGHMARIPKKKHRVLVIYLPEE